MRKNAYEDEIKQLGTVVFTDSKGSWKGNGLWRERRAGGYYTFILSVKFQANLKRLPKASPFETIGRIYLNEQSTVQHFKNRMKDEIGYVPEASTLQDLWGYFTRLRDCYKEQDAYYDAQPKEPAHRILEDLLSIAVERIGKGWTTPNPSLRPQEIDRRLSLDKYLTKEEIAAANEAQMIINGHSFFEPISIIERTGHLAQLNKQIDVALDAHNARSKAETDQQFENQILKYLEVDVFLRRIAAVALDASKEYRTSNTLVELAHRLCGYTTSFEVYHHARPFVELEKMLSPYGMGYARLYQFLPIIQKYINQGGILPPPVSKYERDPQKIYYDDWVHNGVTATRVRRVGRKYIYGESGRKWLRQDTHHFEKAVYIENPMSVQDCIYNELVRLNNIRSVPEAHYQTAEQALIHLQRKPYVKDQTVRYYKRRAEKEEHPVKREAIEWILDGFHYLFLLSKVDTLRRLNSYAWQEDLAKVEKEIQSLQTKHAFQFPDDTAQLINV
ncbi:MAG: hypothetical protein ACQEXV_22500 [Bacillota bacterium]